jgi:hypothetical protein
MLYFQFLLFDCYNKIFIKFVKYILMINITKDKINDLLFYKLTTNKILIVCKK